MLNASWRRRPKTLPTQEIASRTNQYLNDILAYCPNLDLNVFTEEEVKQEGCGYIRYHLAGQGPFASFGRMVQYLEFGPRLMKLNNFDIRELHRVNDDMGRIEHTVQFDVDVLAYYSEQEPFADTWPRSPSRQPRSPRSRTIPSARWLPPRSAQHLRSSECGAVHLARHHEGKAFISDQNNQLVMLSEGDEVYLGYVSKIMPERRQVLFLLNKGGIIERFMLTLRLDNQNVGPQKK